MNTKANGTPKDSETNTPAKSSFAGQVWQTLSRINVNNHTETKGNDKFKLTYLSWTWAWQTLMENYPESWYEFEDEKTLPNGTVEVIVNVAVCEGECAVHRKMTLPVMDHKNASVQNPTTRQISDARMRCLVKCLAMFGLGLYIYAGEDLPAKEKDEAENIKFTPAQKEQFEALLTKDDAIGFVAFMASLDEETQISLHNSFSGGGKSSGKQKVRDLTSEGVDKWADLIADIESLIDADDSVGLAEAVGELTQTEKVFLKNKIGAAKIRKIGEMVKGAA